MLSRANLRVSFCIFLLCCCQCFLHQLAHFVLADPPWGWVGTPNSQLGSRWHLLLDQSDHLFFADTCVGKAIMDDISTGFESYLLNQDVVQQPQNPHETSSKLRLNDNLSGRRVDSITDASTNFFSNLQYLRNVLSVDVALLPEPALWSTCSREGQLVGRDC